MAPHHLSLLIEAAQGGDDQAIEDLMRIYQEGIYQTALFMVKNEEDAKDITQEVCIKLYKNLQQLQTIDAFDSWLRIITINECKMFFRKNSHPTVSIDQDDELEELLQTYHEERIDEIPHERVDRIENDRILFDLIKGLPDKFSQVLVLFFYAEMSYSEIAAALKISEGTVKSRLFTAKKKLEAAILKYEKQNDITLHTPDALGGIGRWLMQALSHTETITQTASQLTPAAMSTVSTHTAAVVSTSVSNSAATKISIATASVSVAVCIGITAHVIQPDSVDVPETDPTPSVIESVPEAAEPESSLASSEEPSTPSEPSLPESSVVVSVEPSVVYVREEAEPSVIYRDREVVRDAEPSVVYVNTETVRRYDQYTDITDTGDEHMDLRIYNQSNEATLKYYIVTPDKDIILPSYIDFEGKKVPVTRMSYGCLNFSDVSHRSKPVALQLPEKLESIPDSCFENANIATVTGGNNVSSIGRFAFWNCEIKELNMREVFPNVVDIEESAFYNNPLEKLVLPDGLMRLPVSAFYRTNLKEVSSLADNNVYVPPAENVHLFISGSTINTLHYFSWAKPVDYKRQVIEIKNMYLELLDPNAVFDDSRIFANGSLNSGLFSLLEYTAAENLYLPKGMKKLRSYEFECIETRPDEPETDEESDTYGRVKNLILSSTITEIEPNAFSTSRGVIKNILLPKPGRSKAELLTLKNSILKSKQFKVLAENESFIYFTDPIATFPEGTYRTDDPQNYLTEDELNEEPIAEDPFIDDEILDDPIIDDEPEWIELPIEEEPIEEDPIEEEPIEIDDPIEEEPDP